MKIKLWIVIGALLSIAFLETGCATGSYQDNGFYGTPINDRMTRMAEQYEGPLRNPVIVIHGLLGAKIADQNGKTVWGHFSPAEMAAGTHFQKLAHPMKKGVPLPRLKNQTAPAGLLEKSEVRILGLQFYLDNYDILLTALKQAGYVPEPKHLYPDKHYPTLFTFYYDWRRDISENAAQLDRFIKEKKVLLQRQYRAMYGTQQDYDIQFDLVGHSMGGLVARYYLRYGGKILPDEAQKLPPPDWAGAEHVDKVVVIGTPNSGYADTLLELRNGLRLISGSPAYPPALIGTFLSYYEMLPAPENNLVREKQSGKTIDLYDLNTWLKYQWGLADPEQDVWLQKLLPEVKNPKERREIALDHLRKALIKAKLFRQAISYPAENCPKDVSLWLIAGNAVETNAALEVAPNGELFVTERAAGDGKVTFSSGCQDSRAGGIWYPYMVTPINWKAVYPVPGGHMGIMNSPFFNAILKHILLNVRNADSGKPRQKGSETKP